MKKIILMTLCVLAFAACSKPEVETPSNPDNPEITDPENPEVNPSDPDVPGKTLLCKIENFTDDGEKLVESVFTYDASGRLSSWTNTTYSYNSSYSDLYEFQYEENRIIVSSSSCDITANLDASGRVIELTSSDKPMIVSDRSAAVEKITFVYDENGFLSEQNSEMPAGTFHFDWQDGNIVKIFDKNEPAADYSEFTYSDQAVDCNLDLHFLSDLSNFYTLLSPESLTPFGLIKTMGNPCRNLPSKVHSVYVEDGCYNTYDFTYQIEEGLLKRVDYVVGIGMDTTFDPQENISYYTVFTYQN